MGTLDGRRVVVVGLERSGRSAAALALREGAEVTCVDLKTDQPPVPGARLELGPHRRETFVGADLLVVSPGVKAAQPDVAAAVEAGVDVVGELGFAARYVRAPIVAITGTNGKSTVTDCTGRLLAADGRRVFVGGNLGTPLSEAVLRGGAWDVVVVEVSSYQLELPGAFAPHVAAILNLTPDHLARHGTMDAYGATKARVFERMVPGDVGFVPRADERLVRLTEGVGQGTRLWLGDLPGVRRRGRAARIELPGVTADLDLSPVRLFGEHNLDNVATAAALALAAGADPAVVQATLGTLEALPHRLQPVAEGRGVLWVNDSKATNVDATTVALDGIDRPAVVLLGGAWKGTGYGALAPHLRRHRAVVTFGQDGDRIADELEAEGIVPRRVPRMRDAMELAATLAGPGDAILLSPACASFDEFRNFEHRGEVFAAIARELA